MEFNTEYEMSLIFKDFLFSNTDDNKSIKIFEEFKSPFGIPDYLIVEESCNIVISVELKLKNWRRALIQAFKYKSFSNISFVVLDKEVKHIALSNIDEFKKSNIGLAIFSKDKKIEILYYPDFDKPYSECFFTKVVQDIKFDDYIESNYENKIDKIAQFINNHDQLVLLSNFVF